MVDQTWINDLNRFADDNEYYGDKKYITNSMLSRLNQSPKHLEHYMRYGSSTSQALEFGKAFHWCILEPEKFENNVTFFEGRKYGKKWDEFKVENQNMVILTQNEINNLRRMSEIIADNNLAYDLITNAKPEVPMIWEDEETGVLCKGKADCVADDYILDIKTTRESNLSMFKRSAYKYGYDRQASFYADGFNKQSFWFVCIEKEPPFNLIIASCSDHFMEEGRDKYRLLLDKYKHHFLSDQKKPIQNYELGEL